MDEEAEIGYLFPTSNVEPTNLEIKVLTKKYVVSLPNAQFLCTNRDVHYPIDRTKNVKHFPLQANFRQRNIR